MGWADVDGGAPYYFAHSYAAETPVRDRVVGGDRRRGALGLVPRRAVPSREERRRRRALPRPGPDGGERAIPLPRLIPCLDVAGGRVVKGVKFQGLRDVGDPVELGAAYSDRGADELVFLDVKATLEERDTLVGRRAPRRRAARDPVHGRRRHPLGRRRRRAALRPAPTRSRSTRRRSRSPSLITELAEKLGSQAVVVAIDTEGGRVRTRAGTTETARAARSSGRARPRSAARGRSCSPRSTPTARARATTSRSRARSPTRSRCR